MILLFTYMMLIYTLHVKLNYTHFNDTKLSF